MGKVRRLDYYPDEYISGVAGVLSAEEQGVYWMVCSLIMSEGKAIEFNKNRFATLCSIRPSKAKKIIDRLVETGKLVIDNEGKVTQKRAESEVKNAQNRIESAQKRGEKGGRPFGKDKQNQQNEKATGFSASNLTTNHQPPTTNQQVSKETIVKSTKPPKRRLSYPSDFEAFWSEYPTDSLMSKKQAFEAWKKLADSEKEDVIASLDAFKAHCRKDMDYRPVHACRYISQERWVGFAAQQAKTNKQVFVPKGSKRWNAILQSRGKVDMPTMDRNGMVGWLFDEEVVNRAVTSFDEVRFNANSGLTRIATPKVAAE